LSGFIIPALIVVGFKSAFYYFWIANPEQLVALDKIAKASKVGGISNLDIIQKESRARDARISGKVKSSGLSLFLLFDQ